MPSTAAAGATAADRLSATSFPSGFLWGAATSAYQVEGAVDEEGRGLSIWDTFSHAPGRTAGGETGDVACDHYHRHAEDVALMASLGLGAYRFSVAWPRIQPEGRGPPNQAGLDFYRCLVAELRERDVVPVATLYHWDLPQWLQDAGGWPERDTAARFADYASIVAGALGDQVGLWITLNEPWVAAWLGYGVGIHAPGHRDLREAVAAGHHLLVGHGLAVDAIRTGGGRDVGITLDFLPFVPASDSDEDRAAACRADLHRNRWFLDPVMGLGYPGELLEHYRGSVDLSFIRDGDLDAIARPVDFVGANYYRRDLASARRPQGVQSDELPGRIGAWSFARPGAPTTAMGWAVEPKGLTDLLAGLHKAHPDLTLYVTENGAAFDDRVGPDGRVEDTARVAYLRSHVRAVQAAVEAGVDVRGYFVWSLLDNFEWAEGYSKRFGLVRVDYPTQRRIPKRSAHWYGQVISAGGRV